MKQRYVKVGRRNYFDPSVVRLVELHSEISQDPEEIIRYLIRKDLTDARNDGWSGPPFDPKDFASTIGIPCEKSDTLFHSEDAELQPHPTKEGRSIIKYNPHKPQKRQNFSIAHEIAHTFFPEYQHKYKARHKIGKFDPNYEVEFLCDLGASEIIMPTPDFDLDVENMGISLKSLRVLSKRYQASLEATAIRMIGTDFYPCALIVLDYSHKPTEKNKIEESKGQLNLFGDFPWAPPMKLRVQYSVRGTHFSAYIPKHKSIEESSPLHEVSVTRKAFQGDTVLHLGRYTLNTYIEAMALPKTQNTDLDSRVIAILSHTRKNS